QRSGPSTGMPTKMEQSDLGFVLSAGHGDTPRLVIAPANVADCYELMIQAFNMADRYQMPVIFLTDQSLTARVESVDRSVFKPLPLQGRLEARVKGQQTRNNHYGHLAEPVAVGVEGHDYARYAYAENGISPLSTPGSGAPVYTATGLEHNQHG